MPSIWTIRVSVTRWAIAVLLLAWSAGWATRTSAQELLQTGCSTCNSGLVSAAMAAPGPLPDGLAPGGLLDLPPDALPPGAFGPWAPPPDPPCPGCGCAGGSCVPGRRQCPVCNPKNPFERFCCTLYECICCPDPCYEGKWIPLADTAFHVEGARPVINQRFRWNSAQRVIFPDRNEFFWARADGQGKGPPPTSPYKGELSLRHNDLIMVTEGGTGRITLVVTTPYRSLEADQFKRAAGFSDISIGTKTLLFDCELLQVSTLFTTYMPSGNARKGLGTGHVTLEPSLLVGVKLTPTTYFQGQLSQWIPLGGDPSYAGGVLHYHMAINQEIYRFMPDVPLIGTCEFQGWSFQDGLYTNPYTGPTKSSGETYAMLGLGFRLFVCDRVDFGLSANFSLTEQHFDRQNYVAEFRVRY